MALAVAEPERLPGRLTRAAEEPGPATAGVTSEHDIDDVVRSGEHVMSYPLAASQKADAVPGARRLQVRDAAGHAGRQWRIWTHLLGVASLWSDT